MAVDLMSCGGNAYENRTFQQAAMVGLRNIELMVSSLSPCATGEAIEVAATFSSSAAGCRGVDTCRHQF
jgi:hypothetical protein